MTKFSTTEFVKSGINLMIEPRLIFLVLFTWTIIFVSRGNEQLEIFQILKRMGHAVDVKIVTLGYVFCVTFSINACYQRREATLKEIGRAVASLAMIYQIIINHESSKNLQLTQHLMKHWMADVLFTLHAYMYDMDVEEMHGRVYTVAQRSHARTLYTLINELGGKIAKKQIAQDLPVSTRNSVFRACQEVISNFECMRIVKDYKTPFGIQAFCLITLYLFPFVLTPYFVYGSCGKEPNCALSYAAYFWSWLFFFSLSSLATVQTKLDDPFDMDSFEDDIVMHIDDIIDNCTAAPLETSNIQSVNETDHDHDIQPQFVSKTVTNSRRSTHSPVQSLQFQSASAKNQMQNQLQNMRGFGTDSIDSGTITNRNENLVASYFRSM